VALVVTNPVKRFARPLVRTFSRGGYGRGYEHRTAMCSRCKTAVAHWLQSRGCFQRYYCDECVERTAAWKDQQATKAKEK
jgi:hypothetical protein